MGERKVRPTPTDVHPIQIVLAVGAVVIALLALMKCSNDCDKKGGVLVRSTFGMECVEKR
jgi:hypothetical protein